MASISAGHPLTAEVKLNVTQDGLPPSHHVLAPAPGTTLSSYLPHWNPQPATPTLQQNGDSLQSNQLQDDNESQGITCLPNSIALVESHKVVRTGFRNPWPSWHKPTVTEVWQGLEWGEDNDPAIDYAMLDADLTASPNAATEGADVSTDPYKDSRPGTPDLEDAAPDRPSTSPHEDNRSAQSPTSWFTQQAVSSAAPYTRQQKIKMATKQLLSIQQPSFNFDSDKRLKATWLGHAGVLVQLPPLAKGQPIRILFDPIFSQRCSPTQIAGPIRSYAAPCPVSSLPPIDLVIISHNHYDHLDYDTIRQLWAANKDRLRFVVPLGNKDWFAGSHSVETALHPTSSTATAGSSTASSSSWSLAPTAVTNATTTSNLSIPPERVTELDWWDELLLSQPGATSDDIDKVLRVVCTPAQHGSGRYGVDTNCALWSSWFVEHPGTKGDATPTKIFFGGDTGCQFHGRSFPPSPPRPVEGDAAEAEATPNSEIGSLGDDATLTSLPSKRTPTYRGGMRLQAEGEEEDQYPACPAFEEIVERLGTPTFLMLPISVGATISFLRSYVPLPDSISPFPRISSGLTAANHMPPWDAVSVFDKMTSSEQQEAVCMGIHWGTFISGPEEVLKTLGQLKWACVQHGVHFARDDALHESGMVKQSRGGAGKTFVALNHGASLTM